ncbi:TPA: hypothetical protein ACGRIC_002920, partial [Listeria monocytogenes]
LRAISLHYLPTVRPKSIPASHFVTQYPNMLTTIHTHKETTSAKIDAVPKLYSSIFSKKVHKRK